MSGSGHETIEFALPGLESPAEIIVDSWGIPHIRAATRRDLFYVQGFNAARDRLWQLDLWRKRGLGLMAADHGPGFLAQDRAARLFLYRGDMADDWNAYGVTDARAVTEAFVEGLNAFIPLTEMRPDLLPPEFTAMGIRPRRWQAEDVVRVRSHALVRNVLAEALRAQVAARAGLEVDRIRAGLSDPGRTEIPDGLRVEDIPLDLMDVFLLATAPVSFSPARLSASLAEAGRWTKISMSAIRSVWFEPGGSAYFASLAFLRAVTLRRSRRRCATGRCHPATGSMRTRRATSPGSLQGGCRAVRIGMACCRSQGMGGTNGTGSAMRRSCRGSAIRPPVSWRRQTK